jgi:hypothetical protein
MWEYETTKGNIIESIACKFPSHKTPETNP